MQTPIREKNLFSLAYQLIPEVQKADLRLWNAYV